MEQAFATAGLSATGPTHRTTGTALAFLDRVSTTPPLQAFETLTGG